MIHSTLGVLFAFLSSIDKSCSKSKLNEKVDEIYYICKSCVIWKYNSRAQPYYSDPTLSQEIQPMAAQLSMKAALPLAKILATVSCRSIRQGLVTCTFVCIRYV